MGKHKKRFVVMQLHPAKGEYPLRIFKHREAAEEFAGHGQNRIVWTFGYWTGKHWDLGPA